MGIDSIATIILVLQYFWEQVVHTSKKTGLAGWKIPLKIQIFLRKIVLERENYQFSNVLRKGQQAYSKTKVS